MLAFFPVPSTCIFCALLVNLPPFRNSYPGSHGTHSSPFPNSVGALVLIARKKKVHIKFLPSRPLASNWCAFMQPTSMQPTRILHSTQAARRFLWSVCILMFLFHAYMSTRTNTHMTPSNILLYIYM